jgi:hypothetical protein
MRANHEILRTCLIDSYLLAPDPAVPSAACNIGSPLGVIAGRAREVLSLGYSPGGNVLAKVMPPRVSGSKTQFT